MVVSANSSLRQTDRQTDKRAVITLVIIIHIMSMYFIFVGMHLQIVHKLNKLKSCIGTHSSQTKILQICYLFTVYGLPMNRINES